ncbi:hypothetical protein-transmembrane prediction [Rhodopirellula baltica SH 1]|uniref:Uncharacterized protein n=1 Tax=Rhodopirellula baltica (strain DSM 10527 / NCIMB 13988 / SH1) TaxID=243090 RepID=Q7UWJ3_RHOBA|nr:hypothetical protein-transmembrane prediction [Rhodopirellula baltica SH 1]
MNGRSSSRFNSRCAQSTPVRFHHEAWSSSVAGYEHTWTTVATLTIATLSIEMVGVVNCDVFQAILLTLIFGRNYTLE